MDPSLGAKAQDPALIDPGPTSVNPSRGARELSTSTEFLGLASVDPRLVPCSCLGAKNPGLRPQYPCEVP